jgi:hypothetical protein
MDISNVLTLKSVSPEALSELEYLHQQYPWLSKEEIMEAISRFGENKNRILPYLDLKSGHWSMIDFPEW